MFHVSPSYISSDSIILNVISYPIKSSPPGTPYSTISSKIIHSYSPTHALAQLK